MSTMIPIHESFNSKTGMPKLPKENLIEAYPFVNKNVRGIMVLFNLYFPSDKTWMNCLVVIRNLILFIRVLKCSLLVF